MLSRIGPGFSIDCRVKLSYIVQAFHFFAGDLIAKLIEDIKEKAKQLKKHIVLPDATDERAIKAARVCTDEGIASVSLVGDDDEVRSKAKQIGTSLEKIRVIDPSKSDKLSDFSHIYFNLRKSKGIQFEEARQTVQKPLFFGAMMVREGMADGSVAGSLSTTADVLRAGIQMLGLAPDSTTKAGCLLCSLSRDLRRMTCAL